MSLAGTTGILDGIQAAAVPVRRRRLRLLPYALLAPSLLFLVLFTYLPVARVLVELFYDKPHGTGAATTFVGLGNYAKVLADPAFRQAALNNLVYAVGVLVPTLVLALAFALARAALDAIFGRAAHGVLLSVAGAAGGGGLAVLLHLPAARRPARLLPRQDRPARARTGWAIPTSPCGR